MQQRKKILFINGHLNAGGCERSLVDLLCHLDYTKYQVDLLLLEELGDYYRELPPEVNVHLFSLNQAFGPFVKCIKDSLRHKDWFSLFFRIIFFFSQQFGKRQLRFSRHLFRGLTGWYDAVIAYRPGICSDLAAYVFHANKRITWWHHGEFNYSIKQQSDLDNTYRVFDTIIAVSSCSAALILNHIASAQGKVSIIPNMICKENLIKKALSGPELSLDDYLIVTVGRMSPEKNMKLCPEVGKLLLDRGFAFKWYLIGDGAEYQEIKERLDELQIDHHFTLFGRLDNPYPFISKANCLVHPSLVESQGLTVLEAMALQTPVIVVKSDGPSEFIKNGINGILVEADAEKLAEAIIQLSSESDSQAKMVSSGLETVNQYSPYNTIIKFEELI